MFGAAESDGAAPIALSCGDRLISRPAAIAGSPPILLYFPVPPAQWKADPYVVETLAPCDQRLSRLLLTETHDFR